MLMILLVASVTLMIDNVEASGGNDTITTYTYAGYFNETTSPDSSKF